jgi:cytochrome c553
MTAEGGTNIYPDVSVTAGMTYYYRIRASNTAGNSSWSNTANVTTQATVTTPLAPSNLAATAASGTRVNLTWTDNSNNEVSFNIQRAANTGFSSGLTNMTATAGSSAFSDTTAVQNTAYYYRIRATNTAGNSTWSNTVNVTTSSTVTAPSAPSNLVATAASGTRVNLTWTDNSSNEVGFRIQRATNSGFTLGVTNATATANVNTYGDTAVVSGTTYYYRLLATNNAGESAWSNVVSAAIPSTVNASQVYTQNCASCHGASRQGGSGPVLTSTSLSSRTVTWLVSFIQGHKTGTSLTSTVVNALVAFLKN